MRIPVGGDGFIIFYGSWAHFYDYDSSFIRWILEYKPSYIYNKMRRYNYDDFKNDFKIYPFSPNLGTLKRKK